jgi:hypothetical protein
MTSRKVPAAGWVTVIVLLIGAALAAVAILGIAGAARRGGATAPTGKSETPAGPSPTSRPGAVHAVPAECPPATVTVATAAELNIALIAPEAGAVIILKDGLYVGNFKATGAATAEKPITLCGGADAVLDGGGPEDGYVLHLDRASHWTVQGLTVRNGQKGVMLDETTESVIQGLSVTSTGDEAIHLRKFSSDNRVVGNKVRGAGLRKPKFGEGIYIGTAESNWCDISACEPDKSDRNQIVGNTISDTTAESIDIKEGTSDGVLIDNSFEGSTITDADSWVDVKGKGWRIEGNTGKNSPLDGFQTHEIVDGWGTENVFRNNTAEVNGPGFGYSLKPMRDNVVDCSNTASKAAQGVSNVPCTN